MINRSNTELVRTNILRFCAWEISTCYLWLSSFYGWKYSCRFNLHTTWTQLRTGVAAKETYDAAMLSTDAYHVQHVCHSSGWAVCLAFPRFGFLNHYLSTVRPLRYALVVSQKARGGKQQCCNITNFGR